VPDADTLARLRARLRDLIGDDAVVDEPSELAHLGHDRCRGEWPVAPALAVLPRDTPSVQAVVRACVEAGVAMVPSGGRTGLTGAATATAGEVVVSLARMHRVLAVDPVGMTLRCQAGATVQAVCEAATAHGLLYPIDFAAKGSAHIAGSIATNAGGIRVLRYGMTRRWVMGLQVVLPTGECIETGGPLKKDNTGYDLTGLFVGAEGTLGLVTEATLELCVPPAATVVALCAVPDDPAIVALFTAVRSSGLPLSAFECFDERGLHHVQAHRGRAGEPGPLEAPAPRYVVVEIEVARPGAEARDAARASLTQVLTQASEAGALEDAVVAGSAREAAALWSLREDISESLHSHGPHKADVSLPIAQIVTFLARWRPLVAQTLPDVEAVVFGHVGDGNLHLNLLRPPSCEPTDFHRRMKAFDRETFELIAELGGSISAEHGIGLLKREHLHYSRSAAELQLMRQLKATLDPQGLMNPGKIFAAG
jgi:FAD/FMN-containing dehydrogenase